MFKQKKIITIQERTKKGILAGIFGLITNSILLGSKFMIGIISGSIAIIADAINNLSDTASSIITLIGFKIAAKPADLRHPYGHERFEYISGLFISIIIIYVGCQFFYSSVRKIIYPENIVLSPIVFIILISSIVLKFIQGKTYMMISRFIDSDTLHTTAKDSYNDVYMTSAILLSSGIEWLTGWWIDGYIGFLLALYILYSGIMMLKDFIYELLGSRPTKEEILAMEKQLNSYDVISGYHDLLIHNYGPSKRFASVHIEVDDRLNLNQAHKIIDIIEKDFEKTLKVSLLCHLDPVPLYNGKYLEIKKKLIMIIEELGKELRIHDFRMIYQKKVLQFDVVVPENFYLSDEELQHIILKEVNEKVGDYQLDVTFDHNYLLL